MPVNIADSNERTADLLFRVGDAQTWKALTLSSGAMLMGGQIALFFSGIVFLQMILYYQLYPSDKPRLKLLVLAVGVLDMFHSFLVCDMNWQNLVDNYGNMQYFVQLNGPVEIAVGVAAWTTILVQGFFTYRIHTLSKGNWYITSVLIVLSVVRLTSAMVSSAELIHFPILEVFFEHLKANFLLGLSVSTLIDILITSILCYYLRRRRSGLARTDRLMESLTLYTVETGLITTVNTTASVICWAAVPKTLVFYSIFVSINKLYANSLLASLNARRLLSSRVHAGAQGVSMSILYPAVPGQPDDATWTHRRTPTASQKPLHVNIDIERTIHKEGFGQAQGGSLDHSADDLVELEGAALRDVKD
ncbi:hypothetical protein C8Q78DRAFT_1081056 [Trametes maxima]|nr:hypothetical protein C8Q78DRAFT_1081056 [Trametes maxima]